MKAKSKNILLHFVCIYSFLTGIEFREVSMVMNAKTDATAQRGMIFNINVGFSNLDNKDAKEEAGKKYALFVGDTVLVNEVSTTLTILCLIPRTTVIAARWILFTPNPGFILKA